MRAPARNHQRWLLGGFVALVAIVVAALVVALDDDEDVTAGSSTTATTGASTATTAATSSTTSATVPGGHPADAFTAVWPWASSDVRFDDPVDAARSFAVDLLGFVDPVVGEFRQGDSRSGEIEIRALDTGPATTVFVRQLSDDTWWVLGAASSLRIDAPEPLASVSSPLTVRGAGVAFEAVIELEVLADGSAAPIARTTAMGGSSEPLPFLATLTFAPPSAAGGAVVARSSSAMDGRPWEVSVVRVAFGEATPAGCGGDATPPGHGPGETVVTVYFHCDADPEGAPVAFHRVVPSTPAVLRATVEQLLAGPTDEEAAAGAFSWFGPDTASLLDSVAVDDADRATIDFDRELPFVIPNASTSAGSALLLAELDATVFQFPSIVSVQYRIEGDCAPFAEWLQFGGCIGSDRPTPVGED